MLPDLPTLKSDLQELLDDHLRTRAHSKLGVFSKVGRVFVHEGNRMRTVRADGSVEETDFKTASAEMVIKRSEVPFLTPEARLAMLDKMADEMAEKMSKTLFESLNATLEAAGQTVDNRGKPLSIDVFLETLEKMDIEFDADGQPAGLQLVTGPAVAPAMQKIREQLQTDPEVQRRHRALMDRKRMEWRAREAARKLVG
jgi:hypothetical protein